jgi:hypothetical protein
MVWVEYLGSVELNLGRLRQFPLGRVYSSIEHEAR